LDAGYSNGEQVAHCEAAGMIPYVPVVRTVNNQGGGRRFGREDFRYEPDSDTYVYPDNKRLLRKSTTQQKPAAAFTVRKCSKKECSLVSYQGPASVVP
jgi:transposase